MFEFIIPALIGVIAGFIGGLLGVGGSIIIIPGLIFYLSQSATGYTGHTQHLIQAAAMICNFFISFPAVVAHYRARAIMKSVVVRLMPTALVGIFLGVALSNSATFARQNGKYLAIGLSLFLCYVVLYNAYRFYLMSKNFQQTPKPDAIATWKVLCVGFPMGLIAGLLGIGGGALCVPAQQLLLKIPLRHAIANSATTIVFTAVFGAIYKNATLASHEESILESLRLAAMLIPTAMIASYFGGKLVHKLPRRLLRLAFIIFMTYVAYKTFISARTTENLVPTPSQIPSIHKNHTTSIPVNYQLLFTEYRP